MAPFVYLSAALILAAAQAAPSVPDPLAPARSGQLQCFEPVVARKVCSALAAYTRGPRGAIQLTGDIMIAPTYPAPLMRTSVSVAVRSGAVCGSVRAGDIETSTVTIAGTRVPQQVAQLFHSQVLAMMGSHLDKEICATFVPDGSIFRTQMTIDGVAHPEMSRRVIWVSPNDGYVVGP